MLKFVVFDPEERLWSLARACLFGADDAPLQADVRREGPLITCERAGSDPASLSVQGLIEPMGEGACVGVGGRLTLRTTLLPERARPYLLSLELARHRLMLFLNKLEEWGLSDLAPTDELMVRFERARGLFTRALVARGDGSEEEADALARAALSLAIDASERLVRADAERRTKLRQSGALHQQAVEHAARSEASDGGPPKGLVRSPEGVGVVLAGVARVGCAVPVETFSDVAQRAALSVCDFIGVPMTWSAMEPTEGKYTFAGTDRWIEWAVRTAKVPVSAGPLIDLRARCVPEWLYIWENDYETLREFVYEHLRHVVTRYRRTVGVWTVASGLHVNESFSLTFEQMMDLTRMCVLVVRKLQPSARVVLEIAQPHGEYAARSKRTMPPLLYAEMVSQANINVDAIGLRLQMGDPGDQGVASDAKPGGAPAVVGGGRDTRDLMAIAELLDRYAGFDRPIHLTAVGAPSRGLAVPGNNPGHWRAGWSEDVQGEWLEHVVSMAASKPYVQSVCWQELIDDASGEMLSGGLFRADGTPKPAAARLAKIRAALREGRSPIEGSEAAP